MNVIWGAGMFVFSSCASTWLFSLLFTKHSLKALSFVFWVACWCLKMFFVFLFPAVTTTLSPGSGHARRCNESEKAYCVNGGDCYYIHGINRLSCKWVSLLSLYSHVNLFILLVGHVVLCLFSLSFSVTDLLITSITILFKSKGFYIFALLF